MADRPTTLLGVFQALNSNISEQIKEANNNIMALLEDPTLLNDLFVVLEIKPSSHDTRLCFILIRQLIIKFGEYYTELYPNLQHILINFLTQYTEINLCKSVCDVISTVAAKTLMYGKWPELFPFVMSNIENYQTRAIGFYLFSTIVNFVVDEIDDNSFIQFVQLFFAGIIDENLEIRLQAYSFISSIMWNIDDPDILDMDSQMANNLHQRLSSIPNDSDELTLLINTIIDFCDPHFQFFQQHIGTFVDLACNEISNGKNTIEIKQNLFRIIESNIEYFDGENLNLFVLTALKLTHESAQESPENIFFSGYFFDKFTEIINPHEGINQIMQYIDSLLQEQTIASYQTALFVLGSVVEGFGKSLHEQILTLINLVQSCFQLNDDIVIEQANYLLDQMIVHCPYAANQYQNDILPFLLPFSDNILILRTLDDLLSLSHCTSNFTNEIIQSMFQLIGKTQFDYKSQAIKVISSSLLYVSSINEELYFEIIPTLNNFIDEESKLSFIELMCILSRVAPAAVKNELGRCMALLEESIVPDNYFIAKTICDCITRLSKQYSDSINMDKVRVMVQQLIQVECDESNEDAVSAYNSYQSSLFIMIGWILCCENIGSYYHTTLSFLVTQITEELNVKCALDALSIAFETISKHETEIDFYSLIINLVNNQEIAFSAYRSLGNLIYYTNCSALQDFQQITYITESILGSLSSPHTSIFFCLNCFIREVKEKISPYVSSLQDLLMSICENCEKSEIGQAFYTSTLLSIHCGDEFHLLQQIISNMCDEELVFQIQCIKSINLILIHSPDVLGDYMKNVQQNVLNILSTATIQDVLNEIVPMYLMLFDCDRWQDKVQRIRYDHEFESESADCLFLALSKIGIHEEFKNVAVQVFSFSDSYLSLISSEAFSFIKSIVSQCTEEDIFIYLLGNEYRIHNVLNHIRNT